MKNNGRIVLNVNNKIVKDLLKVSEGESENQIKDFI